MTTNTATATPRYVGNCEACRYDRTHRHDHLRAIVPTWVAYRDRVADHKRAKAVEAFGVDVHTRARASMDAERAMEAAYAIAVQWTDAERRGYQAWVEANA